MRAEQNPVQSSPSPRGSLAGRALLPAMPCPQPLCALMLCPAVGCGDMSSVCHQEPTEGAVKRGGESVSPMAEVK